MIYFLLKVTDTLSQLPCLGEVNKLFEVQTRKEQPLSRVQRAWAGTFLIHELTGLLSHHNPSQTMKEPFQTQSHNRLKAQHSQVHNQWPTHPQRNVLTDCLCISPQTLLVVNSESVRLFKI